MQPNKKFGPQKPVINNMMTGSHGNNQKPGAPKKNCSHIRVKKKTESHSFHTEQHKHSCQNNFQAHHGMHHGIDNVHHFTHVAQCQGFPRLYPAEQSSMHILPEHNFKTSCVLPLQVRKISIFLGFKFFRCLSSPKRASIFRLLANNFS